MAEFEVTLSAMTDAASNISNLTEQFREQVAQTQQATQTLSEGWEGDASETFKTNMETLNKWWNEMAAALDTYSQELNKARQEYEEADKSAAGNFPG